MKSFVFLLAVCKTYFPLVSFNLGYNISIISLLFFLSFLKHFSLVHCLCIWAKRKMLYILLGGCSFFDNSDTVLIISSISLINTHSFL